MAAWESASQAWTHLWGAVELALTCCQHGYTVMTHQDVVGKDRHVVVMRLWEREWSQSVSSLLPFYTIQSALQWPKSEKCSAVVIDHAPLCVNIQHHRWSLS